MSDLSEDLVGEIFSRVPLTSLMTSLEIHNDVDIVDLSINQVSVFNQIKVSKVFHRFGLLLCITKDNPRLVVWNPYLGKTRWIQPSNSFSKNDMYALGYDNNNRYHKILRLFRSENCFFWSAEVYDCNSDSWRVLDFTPNCDTMDYQSSMSLKGNTYFLDRGNIEKRLLSFDFTAERFGPLLLMPFQSYYDSEYVTLSCVKDEQLALLYQRDGIVKIWITTKIDPYSVSWCMFLRVDRRSTPWFPSDVMAGHFFIDEAEKKVVDVSSFRKYRPTKKRCYQTAYIIGEDGYFKSVDMEEARFRKELPYYDEVVFSSYVPSLVQLEEKIEISN